MRQIISIIVIFTISGVAAGANSYTLESIQSFARANYPAIRQFELIDKIEDFSLADASSAWAPQISLTGHIPE